MTSGLQKTIPERVVEGMTEKYVGSESCKTKKYIFYSEFFKNYNKIQNFIY